jgi:hypothetical protein
MMRAMFESLFTRTQVSPQDITEILEVHQLAHEFHGEMRDRDRFEAYCAWYYATAQKHQQEMAKLQTELQILPWFWRR